MNSQPQQCGQAKTLGRRPGLIQWAAGMPVGRGRQNDHPPYCESYDLENSLYYIQGNDHLNDLM